jgi:hypothetical protein
MEKLIKILVLTNNQILISQIEEVTSELGEPDCKITEPFIVNLDGTLSPWLVDLSSQGSFMIHSDKILTIADPKPTLIEKYQSLIK